VFSSFFSFIALLFAFESCPTIAIEMVGEIEVDQGNDMMIIPLDLDLETGTEIGAAIEEGGIIWEKMRLVVIVDENQSVTETGIAGIETEIAMIDTVGIGTSLETTMPSHLQEMGTCMKM